MEQSAFVFSFCPEDRTIVDQIVKDFDSSPVNMIPDSREGGNINSIINTIHRRSDLPVFLMISDQFLTSEISMESAWDFVVETVPREQLCLVLNNGSASSTYGGKALWDAEVIAYYNHYWNETYKNLRSRRELISPGELETYNWRVRIVRNIKDKVAGFLQELKSCYSIELDEFKKDNYHYLFTALKIHSDKHFEKSKKGEEAIELAGDPDPSKKENMEEPVIDLIEAGLKEEDSESAKNNDLHLTEESKTMPSDKIVSSGKSDTPKKKKKGKKDPQVVLITGATSGIGEAVAKRFASEGYRLILTGRRQDRLDNLQKTLKKKFKTKSITLCFDIRDKDAVKQAISDLEGSWADVDLLINNAGLAKGFDPIHEGNLDHWETMIDTNIKGLLYITRKIAKTMVKRKRGHIINVGSIAGKEVYPMGNVYCATKHAVDALTRAMRLDLYVHDVKVSSVSPGHVETEFALVRFDGDAGKAKVYEDFQPLKAVDIAETIFFIATRPSHVNVQDVVIFGTQQASANHIDRSGRGKNRKS